MEKEKKNKKLILLIVSILVLIIGIVGVTYAAYTFTKTGVVSKLVTGDIYMKYTEGSSINLSGAMPSNSYPTKASGNYFQFQIAGKNTSDGSVSYTLKLAHGDVPSGKSSSNRIADRWLYFKLVEVTNLGANNETETVLVANGNYTTIPNAVLYTTSIPAGTSSTLTKTYRLYARIDNNLIIGNTASANYSESQWNSLFASIKINAEGGYVGTVTINFNANGGTVSPSSKTISQAATTYGTLPTPTPSGSETFAGWFTSLEGGTEITSSTTFTYGTSPTTLYAHWEEAINLITFFVEGVQYQAPIGMTWNDWIGSSYDTSDGLIHLSDCGENNVFFNNRYLVSNDVRILPSDSILSTSYSRSGEIGMLC